MQMFFACFSYYVAAQNKCNIHYKTAPRSNITNEGTRASNVTIATFYISCQIFGNKHAVLCITMINMLYINLSFLFIYAKNKSKRTLNVTFLRQNCKNNRLQFMKWECWCENIFTTKCSRQILLKKYSYWLETFILLVAPKRAFFVCPAVQGFSFFYDFSWIF